MQGMGLFIYPSEVALHLVFNPRKQSQTLLQCVYLLKVWFFKLKQQLIQVSELRAEVQRPPLSSQSCTAQYSSHKPLQVFTFKFMKIK